MKLRSTATLAGTKVWLRPPRRADYREFAALMKASAHFHRWLVVPFRGKSQFDEYRRPSRTGSYYRFLICRRADGVIVGSIGLFHITRLALQSGCTGYMIGAPHARQGYATEALRLVLRFAFRRLKLHRVEANIQPANVASLALVKRVGFSREGISRRYLRIRGRWRDHERWAILVEDWRRLCAR